MANDTLSINKIVSIFRDLALRNKMVTDFGYGPTYNIGASRQMNFPYIWVEQNSTSTNKSDNGYKEAYLTFTIFCMDKISMGDDNYDEIISDTHYILDTMIQEIAQHKFYIDMNLSIDGDIVCDPVVEGTDDNVNGWQCDITLKMPIRYTPCNSPIEPISGYTTQLNSDITEYRLVGATGPAGATGATGPADVKYYGSFYDTTAQTGTSNTLLYMNCNNSDTWNSGVFASGSNRFYIENPGVYNIQFSAQMIKNSGNSSTHTHIWLSQNGTSIPNSASRVDFPSNSVYEVAAWNWLIETTTNDEYIQLPWLIQSNQNNAVSLHTEVATGIIPAIPSVILTITQVD
jgi:hypothetical protein